MSKTAQVMSALHTAEATAPAQRWLPVSSGYPIHIRPLAGGGFELALYVKTLPLLNTAWHQESDIGPQDQVKRVAIALAASCQSTP